MRNTLCLWKIAEMCLQILPLEMQAIENIQCQLGGLAKVGFPKSQFLPLENDDNPHFIE